MAGGDHDACRSLFVDDSIANGRCRRISTGQPSFDIISGHYPCYFASISVRKEAGVKANNHTRVCIVFLPHEIGDSLGN